MTDATATPEEDCLIGDGTSYRGTVSVTESGRTCQHWDSQIPHGHDRTPANYPSSGLEQNYCRNPDGEPSGVWCYTTDPTQRWEYCDVPACSDCLIGDGTSYRGTVSVTESGRTCQHWDSQIPHGHDRTPANYPSSGLEQNYCRNPDGEPFGVWCYTTDPDQRWEYCDVPACSDTAVPTSAPGCGGILTAPPGGTVTSPNFPDVYNNDETCEWTIIVPEGSMVLLTFDSFHLEADFDFLTIYDGGSDSAAELQSLTGEGSIDPISSTANQMFLRFTSDSSLAAQGFQFSYTDCLIGDGTSYRGTVSVTESGRTCQHWDSQIPHGHDRTPANYPSSGLEQNYCRNPDGDPFGVWCYTTDPDQRWEYCDVPACSDTAVPTSAPGCGGILTAPPGGTVTSPNFPDDYNNDETCEWTIIVPEGSMVLLTFDSFHLEANFDFLTIYDGGSDSAAELQSLTGEVSIDPITSTANQMFLRFTSDFIEVAQGFQFSYTDAAGPDVTPEADCLIGDGTSYRGTVSVTESGRTCQHWDSQIPHGHDRTPANYPSSGLEQNYCRNPDGDPSGVWCYTTDPDQRWEHCDVPACSDGDCLESEHQCLDGSCIPANGWCDGVLFDCVQGEDESDCGDDGCLESERQCLDGSCITADWWCDGEYDCSQGEDESDCGGLNCYEDEFQCLNGSCISDDYWCDGEINCLQAEDELNCGGGCLESESQCSDGSCIPANWWCDGQYSDCSQGEDELECGGDSCQESERQCLDGSCILADWWCDGEYDCSQGEDESDCGVGGCQESELQCLDGSCIPEEWWCDELYDCSQGEDESDCWGAWVAKHPNWAIDATATEWPDTSGPDKVLDFEPGTFWNPINPGPWYIIFDLLMPYTLSAIGIANYGDITHDVTAFKFQTSASSHPLDWIDVLDFSESPETMPVQFSVGGFNATSRFWRLYITATGPDNWQPWLVDVGFYGMAADPGSFQCEENERQCSSGWCISPSLWCNNFYRDCPNSEDEADCGDDPGISEYTERDGTYYKVVDQAMMYYEAHQACAVDGGHLANDKTPELHDFLVSLIQGVDAGMDWWIGFHGATADGTWIWSDGTPISNCSFTNWAPGEPSRNYAEDCGHLWAGAGLQWDDTFCYMQKNFICQIGPGEENACAPHGITTEPADVSTAGAAVTTVEEHDVITVTPGGLTTEGQPDTTLLSGGLITTGQPEATMPPGGLTTEGQPEATMPPGGLTTEGQPEATMPPGGLTTEEEPDPTMPPGGPTTAGQPQTTMPPGGPTTAGQPQTTMPPRGTTGIEPMPTDDETWLT
ncbi:uncharacterized protein LOC118405953 [Branchiostoma floridae]|uniref:Uncharacterized protein LOC118405953 n=1 Tax=Branchiostoma floridae TaxID=7739 RepID=A0A9J7KGC3_BRAFL|nr:uncharacterized protein LOC118405953 [Branchiostoma floridae]